MPRLTVLICTHDRAGLLAKALSSLDAAERPAGWAVDVLVAANACRDGTHALLEARTANPPPALPVAWFAEPAPGKSNALNSAMPRLGADLVAFVDDDHRVDAGYLRAVCEAAESHPEADLFCGRILPDWDGSEPAWVHDTGPYRIYPLPVPRFDQGDTARELTPDQAIPGGGNLFLRTPWLHKVGRFATDLGPTGHDLGGSEDLDWVLRALRLGARLRYVPAMVQYHHVDTSRLTLGYLIRKAYKRTASTVRIEPRAGAAAGVPRYLYRKLAAYAFNACTALGAARRRFFLVRTAAALGEMAGHRARRGPAGDRAAPTPPSSH
jgi:GT2 family glycosyltransferase